MENPRLPLYRARQVALGTGVEHLEHAPGRIWDGFSDHTYSEKALFGIFSPMAWITVDPRSPLDRARRVVLGTGLKHLEHIPGRIWEGFTRIWS
ncbi:unnamed protein product [Rotaria sp. Silwood2]|nr:unnamed protein product [Rotaria sp. Silwood2]CAF2562386.1 unnamed protein product [Rotaria sp. Silwood2]CAF2911230.1 unnamed protein product [Rotaria sp. Silwood2]CAF3968080.1 unnamed protein product [Rotaria sp. Silwood2]CAF3990092.1 unnamed protein product [Rotaria sp. Silwood2]